MVAGPNVSATLENSEVVIPSPGPGGSNGYDVDAQGGSVTLIHDWIHTTYNGGTCTQQTPSYGNTGVGYSRQHHGRPFRHRLLRGRYRRLARRQPVLLKVTNSVLISEGTEQPINHDEPLYVWAEAPADIENNTLVDPQVGTTELFGDNQSGTLTEHHRQKQSRSPEIRTTVASDPRLHRRARASRPTSVTIRTPGSSCRATGSRTSTTSTRPADRSRPATRTAVRERRGRATTWTTTCPRSLSPPGHADRQDRRDD